MTDDARCTGCASGCHAYSASKAVQAKDAPEGIFEVPCNHCGQIGYLAIINHPNVRIDKPMGFVKWIAKD